MRDEKVKVNTKSKITREDSTSRWASQRGHQMTSVRSSGKHHTGMNGVLQPQPLNMSSKPLLLLPDGFRSKQARIVCSYWNVMWCLWGKDLAVALRCWVLFSGETGRRGGRNPGTAHSEAAAASCNMASIAQPRKMESR